MSAALKRQPAPADDLRIRRLATLLAHLGEDGRNISSVRLDALAAELDERHDMLVPNSRTWHSGYWHEAAIKLLEVIEKPPSSRAQIARKLRAWE